MSAIVCAMHLIELYLIFAGHFALRQDNIRDITDSLIDHCEDRKLDENSNIQMSDEKVVGIVNDLFGAGEFRPCFFVCEPA